MPLDTRARFDSKTGLIQGYCIIWNSPVHGVLNNKPGTFHWLRSGDYRCARDLDLLYNHDRREYIGPVLSVRLDEKGMYIKARMHEAELLFASEAGLLYFSPDMDRIYTNPIKDGRLTEVSLTARPALPPTKAHREENDAYLSAYIAALAHTKPELLIEAWNLANNGELEP